jgi:hypothetical protein
VRHVLRTNVLVPVLMAREIRQPRVAVVAVAVVVVATVAVVAVVVAEDALVVLDLVEKMALKLLLLRR